MIQLLAISSRARHIIGTIELRWGTNQIECQKFQAMFEAMERRHPSGVPFQERVRVLYFAQFNCNMFVYVHTCLPIDS